VYGIGLVFGKFYPLTKGHQYLIETARRQCGRLYVAIGSRSSETIPPQVRYQWITELYPDVEAVIQPDTLPYFPHECASAEEFYAIWTEALKSVCNGRSPDVLFTSEDYGDTMSDYLHCEHVLVDKDRATVPICATKVRRDPFACWQFLDPVVRPYFVKKVCVYGPESTGKSTLCEQLAKHFQTVWQPEWARDYLGQRHCVYEDMEAIARGHFEAHPRYKRQANKVLFMDTDAITTQVYSEHYYGRCPEYVQAMADQMKQMVDLYLFTDIDVPWVPESGRDLGEPRQRVFLKNQLRSHLDRRGLPYVIVSGTWEQRLQRSIATVEESMFSNSVGMNLK
jgi:HTH-type transcriptional repressor of NAD biosynthesis genes